MLGPVVIEFHELPNGSICWLAPDLTFAVVNEDLAPPVRRAVAQAIQECVRVARCAATDRSTDA